MCGRIMFSYHHTQSVLWIKWWYGGQYSRDHSSPQRAPTGRLPWQFQNRIESAAWWSRRGVRIDRHRYMTRWHQMLNSFPNLSPGFPYNHWSNFSVSSVHNGSGPFLRVRVCVRTAQLSNSLFGLWITPNHDCGYGSLVNSQPVWIEMGVSGSPSRSIHIFI